MKRLLYLILMLTMVACSGDEDINDFVPIASGPSTFLGKDHYYWNYDKEKVGLAIDSSLLHVLLSAESYQRIESARKERGDEPLLYVRHIDSSFFSAGYGGIILNEEIFRYVGAVMTIIKADELLVSDECFYKGFVYKGKEGYDARLMTICVCMNVGYDLDDLMDLANEYDAVVYKSQTYGPSRNDKYYFLFYTNTKYGYSVQTIMNNMFETGLFDIVDASFFLDWGAPEKISHDCRFVEDPIK